MRNALAALTLACAGCAALSIPRTPVPAGAARSGLEVGVASVDITPPPGFPTGGHGPAGAFARGHWGRLRARAFVFADRGAHAVALVSCDLFAVPGGLRQEVARLVALRTQGLGIALPADAIVLAATHTHQSPGNFMTARLYNDFGSRQSGFSPTLFSFLCDRIAEAIVQAVEDLVGAKGSARLVIHVGAVEEDLLRNRSPATFMLNRTRAELLDLWNPPRDGSAAAPARELIRSCEVRGGPPPSRCSPGEGEPPSGWGLSGCPRLTALDRAVTAVEVERVVAGRTELVGALVFLAVHPTVLRPDAPLYSPDFTGVALYGLEHDGRFARRARAGGPVFAFFNGAEGDVTARRGHRDLLEALALGEALADRIARTLDIPGRVVDGASPSTEIAIRSTRIAWRGEGNRQCAEGGARASLAPRPLFGVAAVGGAEDDRTVFYDMGWREGVLGVPQKSAGREGQGLKTPALYSDFVPWLDLTGLLSSPGRFPQEIPLALVDLGPLRLAALPFEASGAVGRALRSALRDLPHGQLELVGLANEYLSYVASADEYGAQDYMAASTIWGPGEAAFLACELAALSQRAASAASDDVAAMTYRAGPLSTGLGPGLFTDRIARSDEGLGEILRDANCAPARGLPSVSWDEPAAPEPRLDAPGSGDALDRSIVALRGSEVWTAPAQTAVEVWRERDGRWTKVEDDRGPGLVTVFLGTAEDRSRSWGSLWLAPLRGDVSGRFAFVVVTAGGRRCTRAFEWPGGADGLRLGTGPCPNEGAPGRSEQRRAASPNLRSSTTSSPQARRTAARESPVFARRAAALGSEIRSSALSPIRARADLDFIDRPC